MTAFHRTFADRLHCAPKPPASEWIEDTIHLPRSTNATAGKVRLFSYQRGIIDQVASDDCRVAVLMAASQVGKSLILDGLLAFWASVDPSPMLLLQPSENKANSWAKERLDPMVANSPKLRTLFPGSRGNKTDSNRYKEFAGGFLAVGSSYKPDDVSSRAIRIVACDEIERYPMSTGKEGDAVSLAMRRQNSFSLTSKTCIVSTPTIRNGRIGEWYRKGDQQRFLVAICPECNGRGQSHYEALSIDHLVFEAGKPSTARYKCERCEHHVTNTERLDAIEQGFWNATVFTGEPGTLSFHLSVLTSPVVSLEDIAQDYERAQVSPVKLRTFQNTALAEESTEGTDEPIETDALRERAIVVEPPFAADVRFVSCGVDVQSSRLEASLLLTCRGNMQVVFDHQQFPGDTSGDDPWRALDAYLGQRFRTVDGRELGIEITGVDSGFSTSRVYAFVAEQNRKRRPVYALKGVDGFDKPQTAWGSKAGGVGARIIRVGVDAVKFDIFSRLKMPLRGPRYIDFSKTLGPAYFEGLGAETLTTKTTRSGDTKLGFVKTDRSNEPLDTLCYAIAMASRIKTPRADKLRERPDIAAIGAQLNNHSGDQHR